ncbi:hypothetical protein L842_2565 [Mycobacterium intracellulare MIN_052511_1280]|nr:hypothetical protein L842_2565 [Mycobacterium intracellulare MIN_052511_1280]
MGPHLGVFDFGGRDRRAVLPQQVVACSAASWVRLAATSAGGTVAASAAS